MYDPSTVNYATVQGKIEYEENVAMQSFAVSIP